MVDIYESMAELVHDCTICTRQQKSVSAEVWCLECEDSLCIDCKKYHALSKGTRQHKTLPINEYTNIKDPILKIINECSEHNERLVAFCFDHNIPICRTCVINVHRRCHQVVKLELLLSNEKSSNALTDIENGVSNMFKDIEKLQVDLQNNLESFCQQGKKIENTITTLRSEMNKTLDTMQTEMIGNLHTQKQEGQEKIELVLRALSNHKSKIIDLQKDIDLIKKHGINPQSFLAVDELEKRYNKASERIIVMAKAKDFQTITLRHDRKNKTFYNFKTNQYDQFNFGYIVTEVSNSKACLLTKKITLPGNMLPVLSIDKLSFKCNSSVDTSCHDTRGCVLLSDGRTFFTCYKKGTLSGFGNYLTDRAFKKKKIEGAFDVAYYEDINCFFISSKNALNKLNVEDEKITPIESTSQYYGIAISNKNLIYCVEDKWGSGIYVRDIFSEIQRSRKHFISAGASGVSYLAEFSNRLYFTSYKENSVTCCDMDGRRIWKFTNDSLKCPLGVSVDNYANVYVVYENCANVVVISADGQRHKVVLSVNDGLDQPQVLHYQRLTNKLLVANKVGKAFIFDVSTV